MIIGTGVDIVKIARKIKVITQKYKVKLIINSSTCTIVNKGTVITLVGACKLTI